MRTFQRPMMIFGTTRHGYKIGHGEVGPAITAGWQVTGTGRRYTYAVPPADQTHPFSVAITISDRADIEAFAQHIHMRYRERNGGYWTGSMGRLHAVYVAAQATPTARTHL